MGGNLLERWEDWRKKSLARYDTISVTLMGKNPSSPAVEMITGTFRDGRTFPEASSSPRACFQPRNLTTKASLLFVFIDSSEASRGKNQ